MYVFSWLTRKLLRPPTQFGFTIIYSDPDLTIYSISLSVLHLYTLIFLLPIPSKKADAIIPAPMEPAATNPIIYGLTFFIVTLSIFFVFVAFEILKWHRSLISLWFQCKGILL